MMWKITESTLIKQFADNYKSSVEDVFSVFPDVIHKINGSKILIKPNFWAPEPTGTGSITDIHLVRAVVETLLDFSPSEVIIGEGSAVGYAFNYEYDTNIVFKEIGLTDLVKDLPVKLVDLNTDQYVEVKRDDYIVFDRIRIAKHVQDCDLLINMPVVKTHIRTRSSLSMKNLKGVLMPQDKKRCHKIGLEEGIVDLNNAVNSDFILIDGIKGIEGVWEYPNDTVDLGVIIGSLNPITADRIGTMLMGIDPDKINTIRLAEQKGISPVESINEKIFPSHLVKNFKETSDRLQEMFPQTIIDIKEACTGCIGSIVAPLLQQYNKGHGDKFCGRVIIAGDSLNKKRISDYISKGKKVLLVGDCSKEECAQFAECDHIPGCPPEWDEVAEFLKKN